MFRFIRILSVFLLISRGGILAAPVPDFHFENITTLNGLSSNDITCLYQDHSGFLWVGTHFGLNRYDGNQVQTFYHNSNDPNSISGNDIVDIIEDHQHIFWIATKDGGLTRYDPSQLREKQFRQFQNNPKDKNSIVTNRLNCLFDYDENYLLVGAEVCSGFFINKKTFEIRYLDIEVWKNSYFDPAHSMLTPTPYSNWIHHVYGNESFLYISFLIGGYVYKIERSRPQLNIPFANGEASPAFSIPSFIIDGDSMAWLAAWGNGFLKQMGLISESQPKAVQKKERDINDQITCVAFWDENFILAGSKSTGLYVVNRKDHSFINLHHNRGDDYSIASNKINCIFKDGQGILWIGTSAGISKFNPVQWQFKAEVLSQEEANEVSHFSVDEDEFHVIRLCSSEGIYRKKPGEDSFSRIPFTYQGDSFEPTYIFRSAGGSDYLCTEKGFFNYNPLLERITPIEIKTYDGNPSTAEMYPQQVRTAITDTINDQIIYIMGILGDGVGIYNPVDFDFMNLVQANNLPHSLGNNLIHSMVKDHPGNLWFGTAEGLYKWSKGFPIKNDFDGFRNIPNDETSLSGNNISGIFVDEKNHLWITTIGNGLNEFDGSIFHHYYTQTASGNNMLGIYSDDHNRFWVPTPGGFEVFDRREHNFNEIAVPNPDWILHYPARMLKRSDGNFYYGAGNYCVSFNPDSFYFENTPPRIYLTDLKVMDNSIFGTSTFENLRFPYNNNFVTINFSSLLLSQSSPVHYMYKLEGLKEDWMVAGNDQKVSFTSLPPGKYNFKVKASRSHGEWSDAMSLVSFEILQPFWTTWWFYLGLLALAAGIIWTVMTVRIRQIGKVQSIRNNIANDLHDDVGSALSTISLYSEVAKMKAGPDDELNEVLDKIMTTSQEMQENMSYIVWSIQPRNDHFDQVVLRMKRYAIEMLQPKNITVKFELDEKLNSVKLSQEQRKELFLIFKEAIHNITKYASCNSVNILVRRESHNMVMEISDDGIGFSKDHVISGNGLYTMKERAKTLGGDFKIHSAPDEGTAVYLVFPFG